MQVQLPNWNEYVVVYLALARLGAVLVPTMPVYRDDEVTYVINHSGAKIAITTPEFRGFGYLDMIRRIRPETGLEHVITVRGGSGDDVLAFEDLIAGEDVPGDELGPVPHADDAHIIIYTSGTESRPKGCEHTFASVAFTAHALANELFGLSSDDVVFMPAPVTHSTGFAVGVLMPLLYGASTHFVDAWEPNNGLRRIAEHRTTVSLAAAPIVQMALGAIQADPSHDISSMRIWASGGAPIPEKLLRDWREHIPDCLPLPLYGTSEGLVVTCVKPGDPATKIVSSDGRPGAHVRVEIRDENGAPVPDGVEGEIAFFSPSVTRGYWNDLERTRAAIGGDGFFATGDLGRIDEDGFLRVTGRIKDIIIRGGINISAREVEEHSLTHPAVANIAVVSMPDDRMGEKVCAFVVPAGDERLTVEDLAAFLQDEHHIAIQKCPERIIFIDELPMTATGKVKKFELRQTAAKAVQQDAT